jgi:hypothetical protein
VAEHRCGHRGDAAQEIALDAREAVRAAARQSPNGTRIEAYPP